MTRKLHRKEKVALQYDERFGAIECILFVSGDPVPVIQLQRALGLTDIEMQSTLQSMDELYRREERGIQLYLTEETVQLVSNRKYTDLVLTLLQPVQSRTFSQSMLETLSIIAYRQPAFEAWNDPRAWQERCCWTANAVWNNGCFPSTLWTAFNQRIASL